MKQSCPLTSETAKSFTSSLTLFYPRIYDANPTEPWTCTAAVSAAAARTCAAWSALGNEAAWQHRKTLTSSCSICWLDSHAPTTSKLTQTNLDTIWLYRGLKLVASQMVGLDDLPITSSESEFTASSGNEDVFELYEWFTRRGVNHFKTTKSL